MKKIRFFFRLRKELEKLEYPKSRMIKVNKYPTDTHNIVNDYEVLGTQSVLNEIVNNKYIENRIDRRESGYYIKVEILGIHQLHPELLFLHTESSISLLKRKRYQELNHDCQFEVQDAYVRLRSITSNDISVYGQSKIYIYIKINDYVYKINVIIVGDECQFSGNLLLRV